MLLLGAETWVVTPVWDGPWGVPVPCGKETDREAPTMEARWKVVVHLGGGGEIRGGVWDDGDLHSAKE